MVIECEFTKINDIINKIDMFYLEDKTIDDCENFNPKHIYNEYRKYNAEKIIKKYNIIDSEISYYIGFIDLNRLDDNNTIIGNKARFKDYTNKEYEEISKKFKSGIQYWYNVNEDKLYIDEYFGIIQFQQGIIDGWNVPIGYENDHKIILYDQFI